MCLKFYFNDYMSKMMPFFGKTIVFRLSYVYRCFYKQKIKVTKNQHFTTSTLEVFATDGILTVTQLAFYQLGIMMKKIVADSAILLKVQPKNTRYSIRCHTDNNKPLYISKVRSNYGKQKIEFIGSKLWNNLEAPIKNLRSMTAFKRELKHHIICNNANIYNLIKC